MLHKPHQSPLRPITYNNVYSIYITLKHLISYHLHPKNTIFT